ncbi:MAG: hypothetical protein FJY19_02800 [Bacteroidetes bacterium]|nr:hypothetical protein [Bacteroidota bacterium]
MPKKEVSLDFITHFLPEGTHQQILFLLQQHRVHLTITRERKTILGNYRHRSGNLQHRITVNGNLNPYAFLVTLLHELAHLLTYEQFNNRVRAHGREWKHCYANLLHTFLTQELLPPSLQKALQEVLVNPAASSCAEDGLMRALRQYDPPKENVHFLEELPVGASFKIKDGRVFRKEALLRKRFKCRDLKTGNYYLFSPVYEVEKLGEQPQ